MRAVPLIACDCPDCAAPRLTRADLISLCVLAGIAVGWALTFVMEFFL